MKKISEVIFEIEKIISDYKHDYEAHNGELNPLELYKISGGISALELLLSWITEKEADEK